MSAHNKYAYNPSASFELVGSVLTITLQNCRQMSVDEIRYRINKLTLEYLELFDACDLIAGCHDCDRLPLSLIKSPPSATLMIDNVDWILAEGSWDDSGRWIDLAIWE